LGGVTEPDPAAAPPPSPISWSLSPPLRRGSANSADEEPPAPAGTSRPDSSIGMIAVVVVDQRFTPYPTNRQDILLCMCRRPLTFCILQAKRWERQAAAAPKKQPVKAKTFFQKAIR